LSGIFRQIKIGACRQYLLFYRNNIISKFATQKVERDCK
jgi:hypothetical protein